MLQKQNTEKAPVRTVETASWHTEKYTHISATPLTPDWLLKSLALPPSDLLGMQTYMLTYMQYTTRHQRMHMLNAHVFRLLYTCSTTSPFHAKTIIKKSHKGKLIWEKGEEERHGDS